MARIKLAVRGGMHDGSYSADFMREKVTEPNSTTAHLPCAIAKHANPPLNRGLLLGIPAIMFGLPLCSWLAFIRIIHDGHGDFRAFYAAGWILRVGDRVRLYDYAVQKFVQDSRVSPEHLALPFNHVAYEALLFFPLTYLHYEWAWITYVLLNLVLLVIAFRCLRPQLEGLALNHKWAPAALFFTFVPVAITLMQGQDSIILLALFSVACSFLERGHDRAAGLMVGLGLFKFQVVMPIAALFVLWRRWDVVKGFVLSTSTMALISLAITGLNGARLYLYLLMNSARQSIEWTFAVYPQLMPNIRGLGFALGCPGLVVGAVSLVLLIIASRAKASLPLTIVVASLVSYHGLIHDMSILLIPGLLRLSSGHSRGWLLLMAPLMIVHLSAFYLASIPVLAFFAMECVVGLGSTARHSDCETSQVPRLQLKHVL